MQAINNKGFTLIELLGVIVILSAIVLIAIPNISTSIKKNKENIKEKQKEEIISAAEEYMNIYDCDYSKSCILQSAYLVDANLISASTISNVFDWNYYKDVEGFEEELEQMFETKEEEEFYTLEFGSYLTYVEYNPNDKKFSFKQMAYEEIINNDIEQISNCTCKRTHNRYEVG